MIVIVCFSDAIQLLLDQFRSRILWCTYIIFTTLLNRLFLNPEGIHYVQDTFYVISTDICLHILYLKQDMNCQVRPNLDSVQSMLLTL